MELTDWLTLNNLDQYVEVFTDNDIDMEVLSSLTEADLKELGVSLGHRRKLQILLVEPTQDVATENPVVATENVAQSKADNAEVTIPPQEAERRQITVMFCDLANSTALSRSLEVETYRALILSYQDLCGHAVRSFDGHLARFFGDGVLVYFGYPSAHEDDAERAVRAAMLIRNSLVSLKAGNENVSARIGIATGPVVVGDIIGEGASQQSTALGEAPNVAARLQSIASPGGIIVADNSKRLMRGQFEFASMGMHDFKGIEEPVLAWQVVSENFADSRFDSARGEAIAEIIGREEEIETLWRRWLQAVDGDGQVVVLSGEAGIGKSRVVRGLQDRLIDVEHNVISFQSSQHHSSTPLFPIITQINRAAKIVAENSDEEKSDKIDELISDCGLFDSEARVALLDLLSISNPAVEPSKDATLQAIIEYAKMHCHTRPALFVFEDVQWIDPTSIDLLDLLVAGAVSRNMMIIITHRNEYDSTWTGEAHVTSMMLNKLAFRMCELLILKVTAEKKLPAELVREILDKTDGVPLFIEELTTTIIESSMVRLDGDQYVLDQPMSSLAIPMTIKDSLMARLDRLSAVKDLAQIGSVIGREFSHQLLDAVAAVPDAELNEGLNRLTDAGLIFKRNSADGVRYVFKHALVQDTAYESMLISRRRQIHARISQCLEQRFPAMIQAQPEMMARHLSRAEFPDKAIPYLRQAANRAMSRSQMVEAHSHTRNALDLLAHLPTTADNDLIRFELLISQISPLVATEGYTTSSIESLYAEAMPIYQRLDNKVDLYPLLFARWIRFLNLGEMQAALDQGWEIHTVATDSASPVMVALAQRLIGAVQLLFGTLHDTNETLAAVLVVIDEARSDELGFVYGQDTLVATWANRAITLCSMGEFGHGQSYVQQTVQRAEQLNHALAVAFANGHLALLFGVMGDEKRLQSCCQNLERAIAEQPMPAWVAVAKGCEGIISLYRGEANDAIAKLSEAIDSMHSMGTRIWESIWYAFHAQSYLAAERPEEAIVAIDAALLHIAEGGGSWPEAELYRLRALALQATGGNEHTIREAFDRSIDIAKKANNCIFWLRAAHSYARYLVTNNFAAEARHQLKASIEAVPDPQDIPIYSQAVSTLKSITPNDSV